MLTGKQKSYLRGLANQIKPVMQVGKDGLNKDGVIEVLNYLEKHELMKISINQNSDATLDDLEAIFNELEIEVVQKIGKTIVLYQHSDKVDNPIKFPVKKSN